VDPWDACKWFFEPDGALRDVYVLSTTLRDWDLVMKDLREGPFSARFHDAEPSGWPSDLRTLFCAKRTLSFRVGHLVFFCHFFNEDQIEFDFDPNGMLAADVDQLLGFVSHVGRLTRRTVLVTPENAIQHPVFRYEPDSDRVVVVGEMRS
jgi:hypothetical protein